MQKEDKELDFTEIGARIRKRRLSMGLKQEYVAEKLDVNPSHISNIECGRAKPSLTALVRLANVFQCSVDVFLSGEYTFSSDVTTDAELDRKIIQNIQHRSKEEKEKIMKIIEII